MHSYAARNRLSISSHGLAGDNRRRGLAEFLAAFRAITVRTIDREHPDPRTKAGQARTVGVIGRSFGTIAEDRLQPPAEFFATSNASRMRIAFDNLQILTAIRRRRRGIGPIGPSRGHLRVSLLRVLSMAGPLVDRRFASTERAAQDECVSRKVPRSKTSTAGLL
jgi:hypothetical protein